MLVVCYKILDKLSSRIGTHVGRVEIGRVEAAPSVDQELHPDFGVFLVSQVSMVSDLIFFKTRCKRERDDVSLKFINTHRSRDRNLYQPFAPEPRALLLLAR